MLRNRIEQAVTTYLATLPLSDKEILRDLPIRFGSPEIRGVGDYMVCDANHFVAIVLCEVPDTMSVVLEARERLKGFLAVTDTHFGVLATGTDPDRWFFAENCRNNWFVEIPRATFESRIAGWHPDMRQTASTLKLQEEVNVWRNRAHRRLTELQQWRWWAVGFGIGFLSAGAALIWYILQ